MPHKHRNGLFAGPDSPFPRRRHAAVTFSGDSNGPRSLSITRRLSQHGDGCRVPFAFVAPCPISFFFFFFFFEIFRRGRTCLSVGFYHRIHQRPTEREASATCIGILQCEVPTYRPLVGPLHCVNSAISVNCSGATVFWKRLLLLTVLYTRCSWTTIPATRRVGAEDARYRYFGITPHFFHVMAQSHLESHIGSHVGL